MKKGYTDEQIIGFLKQAAAGTAVIAMISSASAAVASASALVR